MNSVALGQKVVYHDMECVVTQVYDKNDCLANFCTIKPESVNTSYCVHISKLSEVKNGQ